MTGIIFDKRWPVCGPADREFVAKPFSVKINDVWWDCATNGKAIVAVRTNAPTWDKREHPPITADLLRLSAPATHRFDRDAFLHDAAEDACEECPDCLGLGKHRCGCPRCKYDGACGTCDGWKFMAQEQHWLFVKTYFDATLAYQYLRAVDTSAATLNVRFGEPLEQIAIWPDDGSWRVVVMPMRVDEGAGGRVDHRLDESFFIPVKAA